MAQDLLVLMVNMKSQILNPDSQIPREARRVPQERHGGFSSVEPLGLESWGVL
jgi:hypothetical protein